MLSITLPDGSVRQYEAPLTVGDIAASIGAGLAKAALEASVRYLSYDLGSRGVRVNAISAGPVKTLAASAVSGLKTVFSKVEESAPLHRNIEPLDVGGTAVYLASPLASAITGQVIFVDSGFSMMAF